MRFLLTLLSSFLLLNAQIYAIPAGPVFGDNSGSGVVTGSYAGVLLPSDSSSEMTTDASTTDSEANSLGLFSLTIPATGLGTGTVSIFSSGRAYVGTIDAFGDPDSSQIQGVITATYSYSVVLPVQTTGANGVSTTTFTTQDLQSNLNGKLEAFVTTGSSSGLSNSAGRLEGEATVEISNSVNGDGTPNIDSTQDFTVVGIQQTISG